MCCYVYIAYDLGIVDQQNQQNELRLVGMFSLLLVVPLLAS